MQKEIELMNRKHGFGHGFLNKGTSPFNAGCSSIFDLFGTQKGFDIYAFRKNWLRRNTRNSVEYDFFTTARDLNFAFNQYEKENG